MKSELSRNPVLKTGIPKYKGKIGGPGQEQIFGKILRNLNGKPIFIKVF